jgi:hypothetical protein
MTKQAPFVQWRHSLEGRNLGDHDPNGLINRLPILDVKNRLTLK